MDFNAWSKLWWKWIMSHKKSYSYWYAVSELGEKLDWNFLAANQNTTLDIINENLDEFLSNGTCWSWILKNPHINIEFIDKHINKISHDDGAWFQLSTLHCISQEYKKNNPQYPWDFDVLDYDTEQYSFDDTTPGYTFDEIDSTDPDLVNWCEVSSNTFNRQRWIFQNL